MQISTSITINANPQQVWSVLTNFSNYPTWNPFIQNINGVLQEGKIITATMHQPNSKPMTFKPKLLKEDANKKLIWLGHLFIKGIFDGEHRFELKDNNNGTTTFVQSEKFSGILVPLLKKMILQKTVKGFEMMNAALKVECEGRK
jgi:hypothetical protein